MIPTSTRSRIALNFLICFACVTSGRAQVLEVPFYDDFSKPGLLSPDSSFWLPSGVTLNNTYAVNPPSMFVATFDGRDNRGIPYDRTVNNAFGETDSLLSKPINLSKFTPDSTLILSFFYQPKGLGDLPDPEDSLLVRFKNRNLVWETVWRNDELSENNDFRQVFLPIIDSAFLHPNFQFAFVTKGRQSGPFDTWHLDYVYLETNSKRANEAGFYTDIAVQDIPSPILKHYRAMPIRQFQANAASELADELMVNVINLRRPGEGDRLRTKWIVNELVSGINLLDSTAATLQFFTGQVSNSLNLPQLNIPNTDSVVLSYGYKLFSSDFQSGFVDGVDFTRNDSLFVTAELTNYFAYDDGSAEVGADVDVRLGSVAVRFILNEPDTLGAVKINFTPYFKDQTGSNFLLQVFANNRGKPGRELHQQTVPVTYPKTLNGFVEYTLNGSVAVSDTFYVGWSRLTDEAIPVGFDKNSPQFSDQIFYNLGQDWQTNRSSTGVNRVNGSFMLRPVMGFRNNNTENPNELPLATENEATSEVIVFPNPTNDKIYWSITGTFHAAVYNSSGQKILSERTNRGFLNVSQLPNGLYFLHLSNNQTMFTQKFIIQK